MVSCLGYATELDKLNFDRGFDILVLNNGHCLKITIPISFAYNKCAHLYRSHGKHDRGY